MAGVLKLAVPLVVLALSIPSMATAGAAGAAPSYGEIVRVAPSTLMIVGRPLDVAREQADVANTILHRSRGTLYIVDTGATPSFRPFLRSAIARLRPFRTVVLINTHGHPDHVGNNSVLAEIRGARRRHYLSGRDFALADDFEPFARRSFETISGYIPGFDDPPGQSRALLAPFQPVESSPATRRAIESLPVRAIRIGRLRMRGWSLGGGDVAVLPTRGHTPGELSVYLRGPRLLHMSDELNGFFPAFPESSATRIRRVFGSALQAAAGRDVQRLTNGHTFGVYRGPDRIRALLRGEIATYNAFDRVVRRMLTTPGGATVAEIMAGVRTAPELANAPGGANPSAFTLGLQAVKKLQQVGATRSAAATRAATQFSLPSVSSSCRASRRRVSLTCTVLLTGGGATDGPATARLVTGDRTLARAAGTVRGGDLVLRFARRRPFPRRATLRLLVPTRTGHASLLLTPRL